MANEAIKDLMLTPVGTYWTERELEACQQDCDAKNKNTVEAYQRGLCKSDELAKSLYEAMIRVKNAVGAHDCTCCYCTEFNTVLAAYEAAHPEAKEPRP